MSGFHVDPKKLNDFAGYVGSGSSGSGSGGSGSGGLAAQFQALPGKYPVDTINFGQDSGGNPTGFTDAEELLAAYQRRHQDLIAASDSSFNTFVNQLNALADAAAAIAKRYQDAGDADVVQAQDVDNLLNTVPAPTQTA